MKIPGLVAALLLLTVTTGCATTSNIKDEPVDAGAWHEFTESGPTVRAAARSAIQDLGLRFVEEYFPKPGQTVYIADAGMSGWSWGEVVRVTIDDLTSGSSVRVVSNAKLKLNVTAPDHSQEILSKIAAKLGR